MHTLHRLLEALIRHLAHSVQHRLAARDLLTVLRRRRRIITRGKQYPELSQIHRAVAENILQSHAEAPRGQPEAQGGAVILQAARPRVAHVHLKRRRQVPGPAQDRFPIFGLAEGPVVDLNPALLSDQGLLKL